MGGCLSRQGDPGPEKVGERLVANKRKVADDVSQPAVALTKPDAGLDGREGGDSTVEIVQSPVAVKQHVTDASPKEFSPSTRQVSAQTTLVL